MVPEVEHGPGEAVRTNRARGKEKKNKNDAGGEGGAADRGSQWTRRGMQTLSARKGERGGERGLEKAVPCLQVHSLPLFLWPGGESQPSSRAAWFLCSWSLLIEAVKPQLYTAAPSIFTFCRIEIKQMTLGWRVHEDFIQHTHTASAGVAEYLA